MRQTTNAQRSAVRQWRKKKPDKAYISKLENYRQTQDAPNSLNWWTDDEDASITFPNRPSDRVLAKQLGRSMQAIQVRRSRLKKRKEKNAGVGRS